MTSLQTTTKMAPTFSADGTEDPGSPLSPEYTFCFTGEESILQFFPALLFPPLSGGISNCHQWTVVTVEVCDCAAGWRW